MSFSDAFSRALGIAEAFEHADVPYAIGGAIALMPSIEFSREALRTRARRTAAEVEAWYLSAEAISVFKLLFFRSKDIGDLERLVALADLDAAYVRVWMVEMMGENDVRVAKWDEVIANYGLRQP